MRTMFQKRRTPARARAPQIGKKPGFAANQAGLAAVEFAMIVPVLLLTYLGATDLTQGLAIDRKLGTLAATVSDLAAQEESLSLTQVQGFFDAGLAIMRPFDVDKTRIRLTVVEVVNNSSAVVTGTTATSNWTAATSVDLSRELMDLAIGKYVVLATAQYDYEPMFANIFNTTMRLEQSSFYMVRQEVETFGF